MIDLDSIIKVPINATAENPYFFKASDFPFRDADGDELEIVHILGAPDESQGILRVGSTVLTDQNTAGAGFDVAVTDIGTISYYPIAGQSPRVHSASFLYWVTAGGDLSDTGGSIRIDLVPPPTLRLRLRLFLEGPLR